jgi:hypothetical protein
MNGKVFLIANNVFLTDEHINNLYIDPDYDVVILFNYMHVPYNALRHIKHKIAFLRVVYTPDLGNDKYLGGVEFLQIQNDFEKVICLDNYDKFDDFADCVKIPCECIDIPTFLDAIQFTHYTDSKIPTSGFFAFLYMSHRYPEREIALVGFTGRYPDGTIPTKNHHNYDFEQAYYNAHNVKCFYTNLI